MGLTPKTITFQSRADLERRMAMRRYERLKESSSKHRFGLTLEIAAGLKFEQLRIRAALL
jgi:hypothetical protein